MPQQRERNAVASPSRKAPVGSVRFAIKLAWDGTDYQGFQSQVHGNTIQDEVEKRLGNMIRRSLRIFGWGRTDAGVHASNAAVTVDLTREEVKRLALARREDGADHEWNLLAAKSIASALREFACNGGLGSITAKSVVPVPWDFDPRFSSKWKRYVYYVADSLQSRSPFVNRYAWQMDRKLDVSKMMDAAELLSGRHNFEWMSVVQENEMRDAVRNLKLEIETIDSMSGPFSTVGRLIKISGTCDFFLYRMMRRIVGVLVNVGNGRVGIEQLDICLKEQDKTGNKASVKKISADLLQTAPAKGLFLDHIEYDF